jgi:lipid A 4'-phosphatase
MQYFLKNFKTSYISNKNFHLFFLIIFALLLLLFFIFPEIDIKISTFFFHPSQKFIYHNLPVVKFLYNSVYYISYILSGFLIFNLIHNLLFKHKLKFLFSYRKIIYLVFALIIGPGLVVNILFKDNVGRARPSQIKEFGGNKDFTKIFKITDNCHKNCSFTSGHAALGFYLTAFAYVIRKYRKNIFYTGLTTGLLIGSARIIQGGHFLSDVLFSGVVVILINHLIYIIMFNKNNDEL